MRRRIQKKSEFATPKNVWFGEWEPVRENSLPASPIATALFAPETAMLNASTATAEKSIERKKHPWVVNVLKESVGTTIITKRILDLGVNLTVGELLTSAPAVKKQLTKAISENEAVQFCINVLSEAEALEAAKPYS